MSSALYRMCGVLQERCAAGKEEEEKATEKAREAMAPQEAFGGGKGGITRGKRLGSLREPRKESQRKLAESGRGSEAVRGPGRRYRRNEILRPRDEDQRIRREPGPLVWEIVVDRSPAAVRLSAEAGLLAAVKLRDVRKEHPEDQVHARP